MSVRMDMDDVISIANDIEEASEMIDANLNGELSEDEKTLTVSEADITEIKEFLFSALTQLGEYR